MKPILIIEDSVDDFEATERALTRDGGLFNPIRHCTTGQEALDYLSSATDADDLPAIILLDLNMPGLDGRAVLARIKSDAKLKEIPVVVLTTSNKETDLNDCYRNGANTFVVKPVEISEFFSAIKRLKEYWFRVAILPRGERDAESA